jgi:hypothetical protein
LVAVQSKQRELCLKYAKLFVVPSVLLMLVPRIFSQQASVSPSALKFAAQVINLVSSGSQAQTVTLTNTGIADLIMTSLQASGGYKQTNNCATLSPRESCTIEVTSVPGTVGNLNGAITITDSAPSSPQIVSLSGKGIAPAQLSPVTTNFGTIAVGSTSQSKAVTLTAAPEGGLSINQITVSGNFGQTNSCPAFLQGGQSCTINVVFHPTVNAAIHGSLAVSTAAGNTPPGIFRSSPRNRVRRRGLRRFGATCYSQFRKQGT